MYLRRRGSNPPRLWLLNGLIPIRELISYCLVISILTVSTSLSQVCDIFSQHFVRLRFVIWTVASGGFFTFQQRMSGVNNNFLLLCWGCFWGHLGIVGSLFFPSRITLELGRRNFSFLGPNLCSDLPSKVENTLFCELFKVQNEMLFYRYYVYPFTA